MNNKLISDYEKLAKAEFDKQIKKVKKRDGTLKGLREFTGSLQKALESIDKDVRTMANNYIKKYNLPDSDVEKINEINRALYNKFVKKLK